MSISDYPRFESFLQNHFPTMHNTELLFVIEFPILLSFETDDNRVFLAYTLDYGHYKKDIRLFITETNYFTLIKLASGKLSITEALTNKDYQFISTNEEITPSLEELRSQLPENDFYITEILPNFVDLSKKESIFKKRLSTRS